jgi:uncharacterized protein YjbI with pentapeptide repeats
MPVMTNANLGFGHPSKMEPFTWMGSKGTSLRFTFRGLSVVDGVRLEGVFFDDVPFGGELLGGAVFRDALSGGALFRDALSGGALFRAALFAGALRGDALPDGTPSPT